MALSKKQVSESDIVMIESDFEMCESESIDSGAEQMEYNHEMSIIKESREVLVNRARSTIDFAMLSNRDPFFGYMPCEHEKKEKNQETVGRQGDISNSTFDLAMISNRDPFFGHMSYERQKEEHNNTEIAERESITWDDTGVASMENTRVTDSRVYPLFEDLSYESEMDIVSRK